MFDVAKQRFSVLGPKFPGLRLVPKHSFDPGEDAHLLVHGDNARVTGALSGRFEEAVKCIYIDPPYNNLETYTHYDDSDLHDVWLERMVQHARQLQKLLKDDGSLWLSIDDRQVHYLKVALDQVFGRENFVTTIVWEHRKSRENRCVFSNNHEYLLVYAKDKRKFARSRNLLPAGSELLSRFRNIDNDHRGPWQSITLNVQAGHATASQFYEIVAPNGTRHRPPKGRCWAFSEGRMKREIAENRIWFGKFGCSVPRQKRFLSESKIGLTPHTLWTAEDVGTTDLAKRDLMRELPEVSVFDTPKPEQLISRVLRIASNKGDLVMDSFLGSGTTALAAVKLDRRFIGIERGDHIFSHCLPRIRKALTEHHSGSDNSVSTGKLNFYSLSVR